MAATPCKDHLGKSFDTYTAMCEHWGTNHTRVKSRLTRGMSLEEALTTKPMSLTDRAKLGKAKSKWGKEFLIGKRA